MNIYQHDNHFYGIKMTAARRARGMTNNKPYRSKAGKHEARQQAYVVNGTHVSPVFRSYHQPVSPYSA